MALGSDPSRVRASGDSILISLARSWGRASGVSRFGPDSVEQQPESSPRRAPAGTLMRTEGFQLVFSDGANLDAHAGVVT